jgi:perosamine synthetase
MSHSTEKLATEKLATEKLDWFGPEMTGGELSRLKDVIDRNYVNDGPLSREFERQIAKRFGVTHAVVVANGTSAITLALMACGIGPGDEVIVPDFTFIATANAARLAGATVVLADINPTRLTLTLEAVKPLITARTRAIVPVDVNGRAANYRQLEPFCREHGLKLISDSCEALGSFFDGRALGSFGDAGCLSFSPNKTVTSGQGGMVLTNDGTIHGRLLELKDQGRRQRGTGGDDLHPVMGYNFKFTDLQAAVGLAQLEVLDQRLNQARIRDKWYRHALDGLPGVEFPDMDEPGEVRQWADVLLDRRDDVRKELNRRQIDVRPYWLPIHRQNPYLKSDIGFATTCNISARALWLPSGFKLSETDVGRVADGIRAAIGN